MLRIFNKLCCVLISYVPVLISPRFNKFKEVRVLINYVAEFLSLTGYGLTLQILSGHSNLRLSPSRALLILEPQFELKKPTR